MNLDAAKATLTPRLRVKLEYVLENTRAVGLDFRVWAAIRDPWTQARMWRQSRSREEIAAALLKLEDQDAPYLAEVLKQVGPQDGRWATNNLPGQSWHQHAEALDLVLVSSAGRTIWAANHPDYERLAQVAHQVGLYSGFYWKHRDVNHLQLRPDASRAYFSWAELDSLTYERHGPHEPPSKAGPAVQDSADARS